MPTYEYRCDACGHEFEHFQSIKAPRLEQCPKCAKKKLNRLIGTGGGVLFKGSGFYQTDYRSDSYKKAAAADSGTSSPSTSKSGRESSGKSAKQGAEKKPSAA